ncbi:TMV resistance protein N-like [Quercus lobata]|uniref:TMV resistance protein N-like n=1 Tax=Quercus lobata TaxID=97700 RepID=UPI001244580D|nr:TMV resistance protein N-like [Quercus lobata]
MVGIHGLPGVGKTTIAKAVYNRIAKHFDGSSFLENVRENLGTDAGIITLQEQLLNDILGNGNWKVGRFRGISLIEKRLCCKKVFLILDDVNDSTRIENLLGKCNWFAPGSRVIITLRDRHVLVALKEKVCTTYKVKEFKVKELNKHQAFQLFTKHAFPGNKPDEDYSKLATKFTNFAKGLPLALEIIARDLCGKTKDEWESALDMYNKIPNKGIQNILQVSYDGLQGTEKDIFLDIACFFKGWDKDYVVKILDACELYPCSGIPRLINKYLITVDRCGRLSMHDLIQQMGREVVRQQEPDIRKRSRLYCYKDSLKVLTGNKWPHYPFHWPWPEYFPEQLVAIEMPHSRIRLPKLIKQECWLENLKGVDLFDCKFITNLPKLWAPNLENLDLTFCENLVEIDECFGSLEKLKRWRLRHCTKLQFLPSQLRLKSLVVFDLIGCSRLKKLPNFHQEMECLKTLYLSGSGIREVPSSIEHLTKLEALSLYECKNLQDLPDSIYKLQQLRDLTTTTAKLRTTAILLIALSDMGL